MVDFKKVLGDARKTKKSTARVEVLLETLRLRHVLKSVSPLRKAIVVWARDEYARLGKTL